MPPLLSVLLPARDAADHLAGALDDLLAQTCRDLEILVVDDGSRDDTAALVRACAARDRRVRLLAQERRGIVAALNLGLASARGELIARMDADDRCPPERLARQVARLRAESELGLIGCPVAPPPGEQWHGGYREYAAWVNALLTPAQIARERFIECPIVHPTLVAWRAVLTAAGGWREGDFPEDYDLILRLANAGVPMAKAADTVYYWRDRPGRASRVDPRYRPDAFFACKTEHLIAGPLAGAQRVVIWGAGKVSRRHARHLAAHGVRVVAWIDIDPRKIGRTHAGAPVVAPDSLPSFRDVPILIYVGRRGARELIRPRLTAAGFHEGTDAWFCA